MSFATYRLTVYISVIFIAASSSLWGQREPGRTDIDRTEHVHAVGACGTHVMESSSDRAEMMENTRRADPDLYARIISDKGVQGRTMSAAPYDEYTFLVRNRVTNLLEEIQGVLVYTGPFSRVWVDVRDTAKASHKPTSSTMRTLFKALDTAVNRTNITPRDATKGILQNDIEVFGGIPTKYIVENRTDFLLLDIKDAVAGQNVLGYFSPTDQSENNESNRMNLLYIDSKEGFQQLQTMLAIIAHEFQHLIHYGRHNTTGADALARDVTLNEGMSEVASILNGYHFRGNNNYLANTNIDFFEWHYGDAILQEIDYQRAMTFAHYVSEHYGERYLYELVGSPEKNMARVTDALRRYGMPEGYDYKEVLKGFAVANYLQSSSNPAFNYTYKLKGGSARPHLSHTGTGFPGTGSAEVFGYGTYYLQYTNPGPMTFRFGGSSDMRVMLMGIRANDTVVVELQANTDYTLPVYAGGPYTRLAFAFINTGGGRREVNWSAQGLTSSVDDAGAATGGLSIGSTMGDASGNATLTYSLPVAGQVRLDLFDTRGLRVRTILAGETRTAGAHREIVDLDGLASGSYVARIVHNGSVASGLVLVAR